MGEQYLRAFVLDETAFFKKGDFIPHFDGFMDVMGDKSDGFFEFFLELQKFVLDLFAIDRVNRPKGLVHE